MNESVAPADTDLRLLREAAYATPDKLEARRAIYAYAADPVDFHGWTLDQVTTWPDAGLVVDLGCGPGTHLARLRTRRPGLTLVGADLSAGMLAAARAAEPTVCPVATDASDLALATDAADVVMALHMLYHVTDLDQTLAGIRRVLRPGGTLLAVTNGLDHFVEFDRLLGAAVGRTGFVRPSARFNLERSGADLARHFDDVDVRHLTGHLVVTDLAPILRFAASMQDLSFVGTGDAAWDTAMTSFEQAVQDRLATEGALRITTHTGAFVCR